MRSEPVMGTSSGSDAVTSWRACACGGGVVPVGQVPRLRERHGRRPFQWRRIGCLLSVNRCYSGWRRVGGMADKDGNVRRAPLRRWCWPDTTIVVDARVASADPSGRRECSAGNKKFQPRLQNPTWMTDRR